MNLKKMKTKTSKLTSILTTENPTMEEIEEKKLKENRKKKMEKQSRGK